MDAKITKQRLGNLLAYDWLKILAVIAAAIALLTLFFTMVRTRPSEEQTFTVYAYCVGKGSQTNHEPNKNLFSYEILTTGEETFESNTTYLFQVRRSAGQGTVLFIADIEVKDENGNVTAQSDLAVLTEGMSGGLAIDTKEYLSDCETYLKKFFGEELKEENLNAELVKETFLARNKKDKRFRTEAKKQAGIAQETERLKKLRTDFLEVRAAVESGLLTHREYEKDGKTYAVAFGLGALNKINRLYYCGRPEDRQDALHLVILNNHNPDSDLRFESVSYLSYLVREYAQ
ncbi:MAG: hypothetical protein K2N74_05840 [Clostridiales bacterium]|nr:hypothetical protein [Clostridiales bacterium]